VFIKELSWGKFGVYADEFFRVRLGTAERVQHEWYFQTAPQFGGKWAFGQTIGDAVRQAGVLEQVHQETRSAARKKEV